MENDNILKLILRNLELIQNIVNQNTTIGRPYEDRHIIELYAEAAVLAESIGISVTSLPYFNLPLKDKTKLTEVVFDFRYKISKYQSGHKYAIESFNNFVTLSSDDVERVQYLINQSRDIIRKASNFDESHRRRILRRLESLQLEIHKSKSNLDVALAAVTEVGSTIGTFGKNVKPLVDRFKEIASIFDKRSDEPLQLPGPQKQLPRPEEENQTEK